MFLVMLIKFFNVSIVQLKINKKLIKLLMSMVRV